MKIVIMGGDISGPMAAAFLSRYLPQDLYEVTLINPSKLEAPEFFAHMPPQLKSLNRDLKIRELDFIKLTQASFSLGSSIRSEVDTFIPFGPLGPILKNIEFRHVLQRVKAQSFIDANLSARLVKARKFILPQSSGPILLSGFDYGYHIDVNSYAQLLTQKAQSLGCRIILENVSSVETSKDEVIGIVLEDEQLIQGDFYLDCSGTQRRLNPSNLKQSWKTINDFPSHYEVETSKSDDSSIRPASHTVLDTRGWSLSYQTQAMKTRMKFSDGTKNFFPGWDKKPWKNKVLSLGLSTCVLPPTDGWNLQLIYDQLQRFIEFIPTNSAMDVFQKEYNRLADERIRRVVDFAILRHMLLDFDIEEIAEEWPDAFYKYEYYKSRGGLAVMDQDEDWTDQWTALLLGRFGWPEYENIMANEIDKSGLAADMKDIEDAIDQIVDRASDHRDFILKNCASEGVI